MREVKPYFELGNVLVNGVFYAATQLYGITFKELDNIPVYQPDVRVFEVLGHRRQSRWRFSIAITSSATTRTAARGCRPSSPSRSCSAPGRSFTTSANLPKPAPGQPALISFDDVTPCSTSSATRLHGMLADTEYPSLSGTATARDFVEFPSQFNEHWAMYPEIFEHYARHYQTGAGDAEGVCATRSSARKNFNAGLSHDGAARRGGARHAMAHAARRDAPAGSGSTSSKAALTKAHSISRRAVPPRYRSSYFSHIWAGGYSAGYYAYLWTEMLADDAYQWFEENGGLTRANGDRFRQMVLSRGNTEDLAAMYAAWRGRAPKVDAMLKDRGLEESGRRGQPDTAGARCQW